MANPFAEEYVSETEDQELVRASVEGDRSSLEELILRHQAWIYNIAWRMVWHPDDAEDVTQDILIKVITKLSSFQGRSSFRTWLYRIVANHVINMKKRRSEDDLYSFDAYGKSIDQTPDYDLPDPRTIPVDIRLIVEETRIGCMTGMLLCLDREQRLIFILGSVLGVTDRLGSEIMGISRANFRQRLCRARRRMTDFMSEKCGLVRERNACHCELKTKALLDCGHVDPLHLLFSTKEAQSVKTVARQKTEQLDDFFEARCQELFREHPFQKSPDFVASFRQLVASDQFQDILHFQH